MGTELNKDNVVYRIMLAASATAALCVSGCASLKGGRTAGWPWKDDKALCANPSLCEPAEAMAAFLIASRFCRDVQNYYEYGGFQANSSKLAIGALGALAGSVASPIAKGSAAKAWSGLSGATNGLQTQMDQAFSGAIAVKRRAAVATAAREGASEYATQSKADEKIIAAVNMARNCAMSSATADQGTMQALATEEKISANPPLKTPAPTPAPKADTP